MSHPASQPFLDSVYSQYAEWGVDLIKNDCIFGDDYEESMIKGVSAAITKGGRDTVYSLSPGQQATPAMAAAVSSVTNMYRVTGDWHGGAMDYHFQVAKAMQPYIGVRGLNGNSFPDLDMLNPYSNARNDSNFRAQMTLWTMARSPLIYGGDIRSPALTAADFSLMTNPEVLAITDRSEENKPVSYDRPGYVAWSAVVRDTKTTYVGFVTTSVSNVVDAFVTFKELGLSASSCT